jgi:hypothetical protein
VADLAELPLWLQAGTYTSENDRMLLRALVDTEGITGSGDFKVSQHSTPAMSVDVAAGIAFVARTAGVGDLYGAESQALVTLTIAASDATNARIDIVVLRVYDAAYSGADSKGTLEVISGTPSGTPTAPATPSDSIKLAEVTVAAGSTSVLDAAILDTRPRAQLSMRRLTSDAAADVGLSIKMAASATGDALQVINNSGTVLAKIDKDGKVIAANLPADTGWVAVTGIAATGWNVTDPSSAAEYRLVNGFIEWNLAIYRSSTTVITGGSTGNIADLDVCTLPAGKRPGRKMSAIPFSVGGAAFGVARLGTDGLLSAITMHTGATISQTDLAQFTIPPYVPEN